ncbi:MAG: sugar phosphate isomerase/epimerase [Clostridia bacterium]|nr:sugar phosphate isomerase/epimerase [Clostridia bacterium]
MGRKIETGAQLYTVRDFCRTKDEFAETLKKVADIGYETVQVSGTCEYEAEWLRDRLAENGLRCVLTHFSEERIANQPLETAKFHAVFGCSHVGLGSWKFDEAKGLDAIREFSDIFRPAAKTLAENGMRFMYHNHNREFRKIDGVNILSLLAEAFYPDEMGFTFDTYWAQYAGADPAYWIDQLSGRVPCLHLKDCGYDRTMEPLGVGNINFDRVFEAAERAGTRYMLVEQDDCNGIDPFECLKTSYDYLKACGF